MSIEKALKPKRDKAFLFTEREGFEPSKPFCDLRDFQSRALDQLGDLSVPPIGRVVL